jgi:hypothetical protein
MSSTKELRAKCYYQFQKFFQLVLRMQHPKCWKSFTAWAKMMLMFTSKKKKLMWLHPCTVFFLLVLNVLSL